MIETTDHSDHCRRDEPRTSVVDWLPSDLIPWTNVSTVRNVNARILRALHALPSIINHGPEVAVMQADVRRVIVALAHDLIALWSDDLAARATTSQQPRPTGSQWDALIRRVDDLVFRVEAALEQTRINRRGLEKLEEHVRRFDPPPTLQEMSVEERIADADGGPLPDFDAENYAGDVDDLLDLVMGPDLQRLTRSLQVSLALLDQLTDQLGGRP